LGIHVVITTKTGRPIAMLKNLTDDSYVKTGISQYEVLKKNARELMPINTIMIVAQAPGYREDEEGRMFVCPSGEKTK